MTIEVKTTPRASLSVTDGVLMMAGIIIGMGIFKSPQLVAMNVGSEAAFIAVWVAGGFAMLIGALVYSELAAAYSSTGGEYRFLSRALGQPVALLFAWARTTVIQTGAIAAVAFVLGDYAQAVYPLGSYGPSLYAAMALALLTAVNISGTYESKTTQNIFSLALIAGLMVLFVIAFMYGGGGATAPVPASSSNAGAIGLAMVFVLLTYGGWNEAAYLSADVKNVRRDMIRILMVGTAVVTAIYVLVNVAFLHVLGLEGLRRSGTIATDVIRTGIGNSAAVMTGVLVCLAALSTINASIFTGARLYHALGDDLNLSRLRAWNDKGNNPRNAILMQSAIAMALVIVGSMTRDGFTAMVEYTAPVFWGFLLLIGASLIVLRRKDPDTERPFRVPLYPVTPILFCLICAYLMYSSLVYTGAGALVGVGVLLLGIPFVAFALRKKDRGPDLMKKAVIPAE
jgi:APA family basic amino acid/polyamine antiporter